MTQELACAPYAAGPSCVNHFLIPTPLALVYSPLTVLYARHTLCIYVYYMSSIR